jgi:hypothetical protein
VRDDALMTVPMPITRSPTAGARTQSLRPKRRRCRPRSLLRHRERSRGAGSPARVLPVRQAQRGQGQSTAPRSATARRRGVFATMDCRKAFISSWVIMGHHGLLRVVVKRRWSGSARSATCIDTKDGVIGKE